MIMPDVYKENFIPCEITPQQGRAFEGFCEALRSHYENQAAIPSQTAVSALRALIELSQGEESDQSHQQWRAMRSPATQLAGITVMVNNQSGDELMLKLDAGGRPHIGTWTLFDEERMPRYMVLFDLIQGSDGWIMRLDNEVGTTEVQIGETSGDLNWTHQPDYQVEMENDDIDKESLSYISDEIAEEIVESVVPPATDAEGLPWTNQPDFGEEIEMDVLAEDDYAEVTAAVDEETEGSALLTDEAFKMDRNELVEKNNETILNPDHPEENPMRENSSLPPKPPPVRRIDSPGQQPPPSFRQPITPLPPQQSNTLALISLVAGVVSIVGMLVAMCVGCVGIFSFLAGVSAAVMGYLSKKQIDQRGGREADRKMANYGMILGIVGAVVSIITVVIGLLLVGFTTGLDWLLSSIPNLA